MWKFIVTWVFVVPSGNFKQHKKITNWYSDRSQAFSVYHNALLQSKNRTTTDSHYIDSVRIDSVKIKQ
jgi:hypothetical protein